MQQDCAKATDNGESKLHCEVHPENELQIFYFGEKSLRKSRMLCVQCIIESNTQGENLNQIVYLNKFLIDPKNTILKILNINKEESYNITTNLDEIDKLLLQFQEAIKHQLFKIKENIQQMRTQIQQIGEELSNELKLNDVVKQIQLLKQMDSCQGTSELKNFENQLNYISENLRKSYMNLYKNIQGNQCGTAKLFQISKYIKLLKTILIAHKKNLQTIYQNQIQLRDLKTLKTFHGFITKFLKENQSNTNFYIKELEMDQMLKLIGPNVTHCKIY